MNILSPFQFLYSISSPYFQFLYYIFLKIKRRDFSLLLHSIIPTLSNTLCHSHGGDMRINFFISIPKNIKYILKIPID